MRRLLLCAATALAIGIAPGDAAGPAPPGATARCQDGSYSFAVHHQGACSHHGGVAVWLSGSGAATGPAVAAGRTVLLAPRRATAGCRPGAEPDRRCSPGAYLSGLTRAVLCAPGFRTGTIRDVPVAEKFAVEREYGMAARPYGHAIEIDHIVALEIGGSNAIANLFPEPGSGAESYHVKDRLENRARELVCAGRLGLRAAQRAMAADWEAFYRRVFGSAP